MVIRKQGTVFEIGECLLEIEEWLSEITMYNRAGIMGNPVTILADQQKELYGSYTSNKVHFVH